MKKIVMLILFGFSWGIFFTSAKAVNLDTRCKNISGFSAGKFSDSKANMCSIYNGSSDSRKKEIVSGTYCKYESSDQNSPFSYISIGIDDFKFHIIVKSPDNSLYTDLTLGNFEAPQAPLNYFADGILSPGNTYGVDLANFDLNENTMCPNEIYLSTHENVDKNFVTYNKYFNILSVSEIGAIAYKKVRTNTNVNYRTDIDEETGNLLDSNGKEIAPNNENDYQSDNDYYYTGMDCYGLLGDPDNSNFPAYWMQLALEIMRYAAIIALVALSIVDFVKAIVSQNQDALKKAISTTGKRFIFAILIFFAPIVVEFIMNLFGVYGTCAL